MSFQAMTWAVDHELPAMQKIVLMMMANRFNEDEGYCWPSHDLLAKECGMDKRSVIRQIDKLQDAGLVTTVKTKLNNGLNSGNKYKLNMFVVGNLKLERDRKNSGDTESLRSVTKSSASDRESFSVVTESHVQVTESHSKQLNKTINQEPVNSKQDITVTSPKPEKSKKTDKEYSDDFEIAFSMYPKRAGDNPKDKAFKSWCARIKEGVSKDDMITGTERYLLYCQKEGNIGTKFVKQAATFFGPSKSFLDAWEISQSQKPYQPKQPAQRPIYEYTPSREKLDMMKTIEGEVLK